MFFVVDCLFNEVFDIFFCMFYGVGVYFWWFFSGIWRLDLGSCRWVFCVFFKGYRRCNRNIWGLNIGCFRSGYGRVVCGGEVNLGGFGSGLLLDNVGCRMWGFWCRYWGWEWGFFEVGVLVVSRCIVNGGRVFYIVVIFDKKNGIVSIFWCIDLYMCDWEILWVSDIFFVILL